MDGRPEAPEVDEALEPLRAVLNGRAVVVVEAEGALGVNLALKTLVDELKLPVVLLAPEGLANFAEIIRPRAAAVGVAVGPELVRQRSGVAELPAVDFARRGIRIALQSAAEDAASRLPLMALYAAHNGLGGDAALRALTIDAARMYKLDDRLGAIAPGKDADLLIFTGHPFDAASRLERVIVGGREAPHEPL
jgi:imidazolonepropionase-like amidohydrolase